MFLLIIKSGFFHSFARFIDESIKRSVHSSKPFMSPIVLLSEKGSTPKGNNLPPLGTNSFPLE